MTRSVLVTGASSGIGAATARLCAERGFAVFGTSRDPGALGPGAPDVRWIAMDVCDDASVRRGVTEVRAAAPRLDAAVLCAGYGIFGSVEEVPLELARAQLETNFFGTLRTLRELLPGMREARHGRLVLLGSLAGRAPVPFWSHYAASKAAIDALALALHGEVRPFGVRVSLVEPGDVATDFNDRMEWGDPAHSAYGERIRRTERVIRESLPKAPPPAAAARTILRALTARRPRVRYTVGADAWLVPLGRRLLPDAAMLRLVRGRFGS